MAISMLIVDDEKNMREILSDVFGEEGFQTDTASDGLTAVSRLNKMDYEVAIVDLRLPDITGIDVIREIRKRSVYTVIIMVTAYSTVDTAIEAMKLGAYDYVIKPFKVDKLKMLVRNAVSGLCDRGTEARLESSAADGFEGVVGSTDEMQQIMDVISDLAPTNATVLIYGESGTGKELLARHIHRKSLRARKPFIKVNCAAIPETLLESELFGHEKGAFTNAVARRPGRFELADQGTIFLDEIGEMSLPMQSKLLRVLQEKEFERVGGTETLRVDVRVIAATNRDIKEMISEAAFREDLYYRLSVVPLTLPPLRRRKSDIPEFCKLFVEKFSEDNGRQVVRVSHEAMQILIGYGWPGNIRELENCIERAVILTKGTEILPTCLYLDGVSVNSPTSGDCGIDRFHLEAASASDPFEPDPESGVEAPTDPRDEPDYHDRGTADGESVSDCGVTDSYLDGNEDDIRSFDDEDLEPKSLEEMEKEHIIEVLRKTGGNRTEASRILSITRRTLLNKIKKYGLR